MEVIITDDIGTTYIDYENGSGNEIENVILAATGYALKALRDGFSFEGFLIERDSTSPETNRVSLSFLRFEGNENDTDLIFFEGNY
jgi:hypothetical protein